VAAKEPNYSDVTLDAIVIYPNPSNGTFINNSTKYSIEVYSIIGQKIFSAENTTKSEITIPNIARGTYLVRISTNQESVIKKLIIN
jgi:hypothetical protein